MIIVRYIGQWKTRSSKRDFQNDFQMLYHNIYYYTIDGEHVLQLKNLSKRRKTDYEKHMQA